jgi:3-dehydroquinate dehydratase-2
MARSILVIHGPNLDRLGERQPELYGSSSLAHLNARLERSAHAAGARLAAVQSNQESVLVDHAQRAKKDGFDFVIINPAAFTHTSVALRDALAVSELPFVEVHLTNVHAREIFRHKSFFSDRAVGVICGLGLQGYQAALDFALAHAA